MVDINWDSKIIINDPYLEGELCDWYGILRTFRIRSNLTKNIIRFSLDREQAIDRVHRPGATKTIHIHTIITKDTVDEKVHNILYTKEGISKYILDNELDFKNNPDLFDMLLK